MIMFSVVRPRLMFPRQGLDVYFPFSPYGVQISMMNMVLMALNKGANGLFEVRQDGSCMTRHMYICNMIITCVFLRFFNIT